VPKINQNFPTLSVPGDRQLIHEQNIRPT